MANILIVEDEMLVAMLIEDMVGNLGHTVVGPALRLDAALAIADTEAIDLAILDINLAGKKSFPVADRLAERGIPVIFASGYGVAGLVPPHQACPVLQKPFDDLQFAAMVSKALDDTGGAQKSKARRERAGRSSGDGAANAL